VASGASPAGAPNELKHKEFMVRIATVSLALNLSLLFSSCVVVGYSGKYGGLVWLGMALLAIALLSVIFWLTRDR
jgi:hypothetical protein